MKLNKHHGDFSEVQQIKAERDKKHKEKLKNYHESVDIRACNIKAIERGTRTSR